MKRVTREKLSELMRLSTRIAEHIYEAVKLSHDLLTDSDWVESLGGREAAVRELEIKAFSSFRGLISLSALLRIYEKFPQRSVWQENDFNLQKLHHMANPADSTGGRSRINWRSRCKQLEHELELLRAELASARTQLKEQSEAAAKAVVDAAELRGQLRGLQSRSDKSRARRVA